MNRTINGVACFTILTLVFCASSSAATFTWKSTVAAGNWNTNTNWVGDVLPPSDFTANIVIDGETLNNNVVTLDTSYTIDTIDISAGDTLVASGADRTLNMNSALAPTGVFNNAGTIQADGVQLAWRGKGSTANTNSGIMEAINGGTFRLDASGDNYTINNSGGIIRAVGGTLALRNKDITVTGGALSIDGTSLLDGPDVQVRYTFDDTTTTNAGTIDWIHTTAGGTRTKFLAFGGTGTFDNTGTINLIQNPDGVGAIRVLDIRIEDTTAFTNQASGEINITALQTVGVTGGDQRALFSLDAGAAASFSNAGTINITHAAGADPLHTARFSSAGSFSNAGTFNIDGQSASIQMAGSDFTQTAGSVNFANDGSITASNVIIDGGSLAGTGAINGNLELNDTLNLEIDVLGATNDVLTVNGNLSLDDITSVLDLDLISGDPIDGTVLVNYTGSLSGQFGSILGLPSGFEIGYGSGFNSSITVNFVPEPSSLLLMGMGLCGVMIRRRRRRLQS